MPPTLVRFAKGVATPKSIRINELLKPPPKCADCRYALRENGKETLCRLFHYSTVTVEKNHQLYFYMDALECRSNIGLCGPEAVYFKPK